MLRLHTVKATDYSWQKRGRLLAKARTTLRFETPTTRQRHIDCREPKVAITGEPTRECLFVHHLTVSERGPERQARMKASEIWHVTGRSLCGRAAPRLCCASASLA